MLAEAQAGRAGPSVVLAPAQTGEADELRLDQGQLIVGDEPGASRYFGQMPPTYLHVSLSRS